MVRRAKVPFGQRYRDSKAIAGQALRLVVRERDLWVLPIVAAATLVVAMAVGIAGGVFAALNGWPVLPDVANLGGFALFLVAVSVLIFPAMVVMTLFHAAFSFALFERMEGRPVTVGQALRRAFGQLGVIIRYNIMAGLVGSVLALVGQLLEHLRWVPLLGRLFQVVGMYGWVAASYFVFPVLVVERERSAFGAVRRSVAIGRAQWGKTVAGVVTVALVALVPYFAVIGIGMIVMLLAVLLGNSLPLFITGLGIMGLAVVLILLSSPLIQAIQVAYQTVLYRFAVTGRVSEPFAEATVRDVWAPYREA